MKIKRRNELLLKSGMILLFTTILFIIFVNTSFAEDSYQYDGITTRVLEGKDRYETNISIIDEGLKNGLNKDTIVIVSGKSYPDALSAGNLTYKYKFPLLLEDENLEKNLENYNPDNLIVIGGSNSVINSKSLENKLKKNYNFIRLSGNNRYDTSNEVITYIENNESIKYEYVGVRGDNYPDALSAVPFAINSNLLVKLSNEQVNYEIIIGGNVKGNSKKHIVGNNRYDTSRKIVEQFPMKNLIVVKGNNYPDALAASSLAGALDANILLVSTSGLSKEDMHIMENVKIGGTIFFVGGGVPTYMPESTGVIYRIGIDEDKTTLYPIETVDSAQLVNPDKPTEPTSPVEPTKPDKPTEPTRPVEPTNPDKPTEPTNPVDKDKILNEEELMVLRKKMFRLINIERKNAGIKELSWQNGLNLESQIRAEELIINFSHTRPNGEDCFSIYSGKIYNGKKIYPRGENVARNGNVETVHEALMKSTKGHREQILNPNAKFVTIGITQDENGTFYYSQLFTSDRLLDK